jgi:small subunit ribosomal protein S9
MNKKTTLKDIGAKLDEFILDSKANNHMYYDPRIHPWDTPKMPQRDQKTADFDWRENLIASFDPKKPHFVDDQSQIYDDHPHVRKEKQEVIDEIEFLDSQRQHGVDGLTPEEE